MNTKRIFMLGSGHEYALNYLRFDMQMIIDEISRTNDSRIFYGIILVHTVLSRDNSPSPLIG